MTPVPSDPDAPMFLRLPVKHRDWLLAALHHAGYHEDAKQVEQFTRHYIDPTLNAERLAWLARARDVRYRDTDIMIQFDNDSTISESDDGGEYVLGWVWVEGDVDEADTAELRGDV